MAKESSHRKALRQARAVTAGMGFRGSAKSQAKAVISRIGNRYEGYTLVQKSNNGTTTDIEWILARNKWNDDGVWDDLETWND